MTTHEKLINVLEKENDLLVPWLQRKEIASWSAVLFYIAILWAFLQFIDEKKDLLWNNSILFLVISLVIIALGYIFSRFIHSQYASIYDWNARSEVLRDIIYNLIEHKDDYLKKNNIEISNIKEHIREKIQNMRLDEVQQFCGKSHPFKIFVYFWALYPIKLYCRLFKKPIKKERLTNFERQEASLYSLLILVWIITAYFLYKILIF